MAAKKSSKSAKSGTRRAVVVAGKRTPFVKAFAEFLKMLDPPTISRNDGPADKRSQNV